MPHFPFKFFDLGFTKVISFTFTEKLLSTFLRQSKIGRGTKRTDFLLPGCCTRIWKSLLFWLFCTYPEYILCILQYAVKHGKNQYMRFSDHPSGQIFIKYGIGNCSSVFILFEYLCSTLHDARTMFKVINWYPLITKTSETFSKYFLNTLPPTKYLNLSQNMIFYF